MRDFISSDKTNFIQGSNVSNFILRHEKIKNAPGGARTPDLRITSAPSAVHASIAYKYDALTDCATGAG